MGAITAILSAVFNGSFAAITKIPAVAKHDLDPILFMCYFTLGSAILHCKLTLCLLETARA